MLTPASFLDLSHVFASNLLLFDCAPAQMAGPRLQALPAESFDVCLFSMVLHHWSQELQREALDKAEHVVVSIKRSEQIL